jgi:dihydroxyacetone kinase
MEMAGASLSLMKLDDELRTFLLTDAECPPWSTGT